MLKLFFSFFITLQAHAISFESFSEFVSLTEDEQTLLEGSSSIDTKYSAAALSYQKPSLWHWHWLKNSIFFDLSIGSIDGTHFLIDDRLKLYKKLNDSFEFRFTYIQEQNIETNYLIHNLELIYWFNKAFGLGGFGEAFYNKRKNDAGLALFYKPHDAFENKLFFTFVDITRNDRNDMSDSFTQNPMAVGIVGRSYEKERVEFFEYALSFEMPTVWRFPNENYEYKYFKKLASLFYKTQFEARLEFMQKYESKYSLQGLTSTVSTGAVRTDRLLSYFRYPMALKSTWNFTPGLAFNHRQWEEDAGGASLTEIIPHFIFDNGFWNFEYDFTIHKKSSEHRLATTYQIAFSEKSNLRIMATWDLVGIFRNKPWGGGNAQFVVYF
ncbi:MAG: hypothetical protein IPM57_00090 [Oligoflexia bacterium]|nr:hypothetical protein [Oligoflexia bacterium]